MFLSFSLARVAGDAKSSLERIQSYLDIEHEPKSTPEGKPPAAWPKTGELKVESLSARYSEVRLPTT